ncbi:MAG TPA: pyridoxal 5'-phosphate synthase glutaminase subunit PdxT [Symbiobacteriaceae bacterium]|nr:pyridoxal 5'-phosphate synthase glutaminase subunit PdxT [Symbiobacteriaceae bacterium]
MSKQRFGVLALQGAVPEHVRALAAVGVEPVAVRWPRDLEGLRGLIIPGGESTTIGDLMQHYGLVDAVRAFAAAGGACYGTCAGAILLATEVLGGKVGQPLLGIIPMTVQRNGFGRQVDSCEVPLTMPAVGTEPIHTVFIRAPFMASTGPGVEVLATHQGKTVAVRYGHHLATAFHPELTEDRRIHRLFVEMALGAVPVVV